MIEPSGRLRRDAAYMAAFAAVAAIGMVFIAEAIVNWRLLDSTAYDAAARRVLNGEPLYGGAVDANSAYRYAPWFAYAWIPLASLPDWLSDAVWSMALIGGALLAVKPLLRRTHASVLALMLFLPLMLGSASGGNIQPLMVGVLVIGIPTRWAWLAIGFAGSLKLVPLAYCAVLIAQRRRLQAAGAVALATALWLPALTMPMDAVTFDTGLPAMLPSPWWVLVPAIAAAGVLALAAKRSRHTAIASGIVALVALPRLFVYELGILLPAVAAEDRPHG